jgi:predicted transcriptional regulator
LRAHGLIAKIQHTRRYRVTENGFAFMSAAIRLRFRAFPKDMALAG